MAFTVEDIDDLIKLLADHPEWRDRLRPVILGEEILQIPSRMDRVEALLEQIAERQAQTAETLDRLVQRMDHFEFRMDRMDSRLGTIEGDLLELRLDKNLANWLRDWVRKPHTVDIDDLVLLDEAVADGRVTRAELRQLAFLDALVRGSERETFSELFLAIEVSQTVNLDDVERASSRSDILRRAGYDARAFVGGYRITEEAERLAEKLNVIVDLRRPAA